MASPREIWLTDMQTPDCFIHTLEPLEREQQGGTTTTELDNSSGVVTRSANPMQIVVRESPIRSKYGGPAKRRKL